MNSRRGRHHNGRQAQAAIEMTIAIISSLVLIVGSFKIWGWRGQTLVGRHQAFEQTRRTAGRHRRPGCVTYYQPGKLSIFGEQDDAGQQLPCQ